MDSGTGVKTTQKKQAAIERDGYQSAVGNGCENAPLSDHSPPLESPPDSTRKAAVPPMIHSPSPFNRTNPVENLSFPELRRIFLGEQTHWSNGRRITLVMLEPGNSEGQAVLVQIYKMGEKTSTIIPSMACSRAKSMLRQKRCRVPQKYSSSS